MRATKLKKNIGQISTKVNESDEKNKQKNIAGNKHVFLGMFFYLPEIGNNQIRELGKKKSFLLIMLMRGLQLMRALIWNREKHSGLTVTPINIGLLGALPTGHTTFNVATTSCAQWVCSIYVVQTGLRRCINVASTSLTLIQRL